MPATITITRPTYTINDNLTPAQFNACTVLSATVPNAEAAVLGVIQLAGDLSAGSAAAPEIGANKITVAKMQQIATLKMLGRQTAATGNIEVLDLSAVGYVLCSAADVAAQRTALGLDSSTGYIAVPHYAAAPSTLTYAGSVAVDFSTGAPTMQTITLTGNLTLTTSGLAAGRCKLIRLVGDGSIRTLTLPAGWKFLNGAAPVSLAANKTAELFLRSWSTADANVIAYYGVEP